MSLSEQLAQSKQLNELWQAMIDGPVPTSRQFLVWLTMYPLAIVEKGIQRCAIWASKQSRYRELTEDDFVRYASGVMANTKRDAAKAQVSRG